MLRPVARFITRMQGEDDGLFVGSAFKGHNVFEPNTVYEIREVLGELVIVKIGQGNGAGSDNCDTNSMSKAQWCGPIFHWGHEIGYIISTVGSKLFLSKEEMFPNWLFKTISGKWKDTNTD